MRFVGMNNWWLFNDFFRLQNVSPEAFRHAVSSV